ncbi:MAG: hypothetical protein M3347_13480, partial [Armatimonadota bacterium]|nr:hypothetical protein [Armatimonadota bacterium]
MSLLSLPCFGRRTGGMLLASLAFLLVLLGASPAEAQPTFTVAAVNPPPTVFESAGNISFRITLTGGTTGQTYQVGYQTVDGTAVGSPPPGGDYTRVSGTVTLGPNANTTITVPILEDASDEFDETFDFQLVAVGGANGAVIGANNSVTATIVDNDPPPTLSISPTTTTRGVSGVQEGNGGVGNTNMVFTVSLSNPSGKPVSFQYSTANNTAVGTSSTDYTPQTGVTVNVPTDTASVTISIPITGDTQDENDETFFVDIFNPVNATLSPNTRATGTILDDDTPSASINDVTVTEGNSGTVNATFTVTLAQSSVQTVSIDYTVTPGTATQ